MKHSITICENTYMAETAAVSCIRYRSEYGVSPMAEFTGGMKAAETRARLVKLVWIMAQPGESIEEFATLCLHEETFVEQALILRARLLMPDDKYTPASQHDTILPTQFDEFDALARMAHVGLPECLIYELTMPQLQATINRSLEYLNKAKNTKPQLVEMSPAEVMGLFGGGGSGKL